jgi:hypothetical protein
MVEMDVPPAVNLLRRGKVKVCILFFYYAPPFPKELYFSEGPQVSPICYSVNSNT